MLSIKGLTYAYHKDKPVLDNVTAEFGLGMIHGILGRNGAGKSTLLNLLAGISRPQGGDIRLNKSQPCGRQAATLARISLLGQELPCVDMPLAAHARLYAPFWPSFSSTRFKNLKVHFGVDSGKRLSDLSHGQRKKALLCFVLSTGASLLLLDEPTSGLDVEAKAQLRSALLDCAAEGCTVVVATHELRELDGVLDHISILDGTRFQLHAEVHALGEALAFGQGPIVPPGAIHSVSRPGGFAYLMPGNGRATRPDLELLYQAVLTQPQRFDVTGGLK